MRLAVHIVAWVLGAGTCLLCAESLFERGCALQEQGRNEAAEQAYRSFLKQEPRSVPALTNLGIVLARQDRLEEAVAAYRKALAIDSSAMPVKIDLALASYRLGNWTDVIKWFGAVLEMQPDDRRALQLSAIAYFESRNYAEAARLYERLLPSNDPSILIGLASTYRELGRKEESDTLLKTVLYQSGQSPEVHYLIGLVEYAREDFTAAKTSFQKAIELDPVRADFYFYLGATYFKQSNLDEAARVWKQAGEVDRQSFSPAFALGALLVERHEYAEALPHLERAIKIRPRDSAAQFELGRLYFYLEQFPKAAEILKSATALNPASKQASFFLARTYQRLGRKQEADAEFERGRKLPEEEASGLVNATVAKGLGADTR